MTPVDIKPEYTEEAFTKLTAPLREQSTNRLDFSTTHQRKDGTTYPVEIHLQLAKFDDEPVYVAMIMDVTKRTQMEAALSQARNFLESAPDATIIVNQSGEIETANTQTVELFGYSQKELRGMSVDALVPDRFRGDHATHRTAFISSPKAREMGADVELYAATKDGKEIPIDVRLSPIKTSDGTLIAASVRDITARKDAELALIEAKDIAESATITKTRFLAAASHDLRQPLQSIGLFLTVLGRQLDNPEKAKEICDKMGNSLAVMGRLLDALLDISKLDAGSIVPDMRDAQLKEILDQVITNNQLQAEQKGLRLVSLAKNDVIHTDPALLERIIENFVTNAIRYTNQGAITINCQASDNALHIQVSDTGQGMPSDEINNVFEEYYQLDNPVRDRQKGLGLGLSIVKHIARLLDHPLAVASELGKGSTFSVTVPLVATEQETPTASAPEGALLGEDRPLVVLFVDDDVAILDATTELLESYGVQVHTALDGDTAMAMLADGLRPDLFISDYRLPNYNGVELVRRVQSKLDRPLPTVIMTGDMSAQEIENAELPNCTILHKPVDGNRLLDMIERLSV